MDRSNAILVMLKPHGFVASTALLSLLSHDMVRHRGNSACGRTESKEAPYETTGNSEELQESNALKLSGGLHFMLLFIFFSLTPMR